MDIYLQSNEENSSCVPGKYPLWIDLGFNNSGVQFNIERALKKVLELMDCNEIRLLYDGHFEEELRSLLIKIKFKDFKKKIIVQDEKFFRGCEADGVVYLGSGHLEAFSRAKLELGIILCCNLSSFKDRYYKYRNALTTASDKIIKKLDLEKQETLEIEDDKILSEWSQWCQDPKLSHEKSNNFDIDFKDCLRTSLGPEAAKIKAYWSNPRHTPSVSELTMASLLAWEGHLIYVKYMKIKNMDITDILKDQMEKLTSIVTERVWIDNLPPTSQLSSILARVKCKRLNLKNIELSVEDTRALVTAMRERVQIVSLSGNVTSLDIDELNKYDLGRSRKFEVKCDMHGHGDRLRRWAADFKEIPASDEALYLAEKLNGKSFIEQIKFVGNEWTGGWESLKSFSGWKQGFKNLFKFSFILWIVR